MSGLGIAMGIFAGFLLGVRVGFALARRHHDKERAKIKLKAKRAT